MDSSTISEQSTTYSRSLLLLRGLPLKGSPITNLAFKNTKTKERKEKALQMTKKSMRHDWALEDQVVNEKGL